MDAVAKDFKQLKKKTKASGKRNAATIAALLKQVRQCRAAIAAEPQQASTAVASLQATDSVTGALKQVKSEHKHLHVAIAKAGKSVDKVFTTTAPTVFKPSAGSDVAIMHAIGDHLYRRGEFSVADAVLSASRRPCSHLNKEPFVQAYRVLKDFRRGDYGSALAWAEANRVGLRSISSSLEFELHSLRFLSILSEPDSARAAIAYAQAHFPKFSTTHMKDIQRLMGAILFPGALQSSPYADLVSTERVAAVEKAIVRDNCLLQGLAQDSPLETTVRAGFLAMPTLRKVQSVLSATGSSYESFQSLPAEIELPSEMHFHSVFACPVTREQVTEDNPPMLLKCGHVVSRESVLELGQRGSRFKCPTCPQIQSLADCLTLHL